MKNPLRIFAFLILFALPSSLVGQTLLSVDPVYAGGYATFHVDNGKPNSLVWICYSFNGPGPTTEPNGLTFDLSPPIKQISPIQLNAQGSTQFGPVSVPPTIGSGTQVWFQGVEFSLMSNPIVELTNMVPITVGSMPPPPRPHMVEIAGGTFEMGDHFGAGGGDELPLHSVTVSTFFMDQCEVTNQMYADFLNLAYQQNWVTMGGLVVYKVGGGGQKLYETSGMTSTSRIHWNGVNGQPRYTVDSGYEDYPVNHLTWYGAAYYSNAMSILDGFTPCYDEISWDCDYLADGYRLPTEAEWEYAARGGSYIPYFAFPWDRNDITANDANYLSSYLVEVGSYPSNNYGLFDMSGNAWEWCNDWYYSSYYSSSPNWNPTGPSSGSYKVVRGGGFAGGAESSLRSANRSSQRPTFLKEYDGFRIVAPRP